MTAIEAEFSALKAADDHAGAADLHDEISQWLDEQLAEIYQKSIGSNVVGHAADVANKKAKLDTRFP
jgi:hypothetical protein